MLALHQVIMFVIEDMGCFQQGRRVLLTQGAACGEVTQMFAYWMSVSRFLQEECQFVCAARNHSVTVWFVIMVTLIQIKKNYKKNKLTFFRRPQIKSRF